MKLLFDLGHPAHVHLFRNLINKVCNEGGEVLAATRHKDVTVDLCKAYKIPQIIISRANTGKPSGRVQELFIRTLKLLWIAAKFKPDALLGTSISIGTVGRLIGRPSFVFNEDDADIVSLFAKFAYRTCNHIVTPQCLRYEDYGIKHLTYPGYHELAYLHPDHFTPNSAVPRSIGLDLDKPYFIFRFVSLEAYHDSNARGLSLEIANKLVNLLINHGRVLITAENELVEELNKYRILLPSEKLHDVLAFASMYIGDSQTVAAEAAVLGVPSLRCNTFVGRITYLYELENDYGLTKGFLPKESDELYATVQEWLLDLKTVRENMQCKRQKMLQKSTNVADWQWQMLCEKLSPE